MKHVIVGTVLVVLAGAAVRAGVPPAWTIEPVDLSGSSGWLLGLEVTASGTIHAAGFRTEYPLGTWYADRAGGAWSASAAMTGTFDDLALDKNDRPHLLVHILDADERRYRVELLRRADDGAWEGTLVFTRRATGFSLAFDSLNRPHVGFIDPDVATLYHAYLEGVTWVTEPVTSRGGFFYMNSFAKIAIDNFDVPHFIWYDFDDDGMEHGVREGNAYVIRVIGTGFGRSLVFDADNHLHLAMVLTYQGYPGYARFDGSAWTTAVVDPRFGDEGAVSLDTSGSPHIVYGIDRGASQIPRPDKLMHAAWDGTQWVTDLITTWPSVGNGAEAQALRIDGNNRMHVVFSDDSFNIYYATARIPEPGECDPDGGDCNLNEVADECDLRDGTSLDCNQNAIPDECDTDSGRSADCQPNDIPDECETDCNGNDVPDDCEKGVGTDLNSNGVPDECEEDCNDNGVPDDVDIVRGTVVDCNGNAVPDECELDCNDNGVHDACDLDPTDPDRNEQVSADCDGNGVPDECDADCNTNGIPDVCDVAGGSSVDCDQNGLPDECQGEDDADTDGVLDPCDACLGSDTVPTVVIDGCDTGVTNGVDGEGCTIADGVASCGERASSHGTFVRCVVMLGGRLRAVEQLDGDEFGRLMSCTAQAKSTAEAVFSAPSTDRVRGGHRLTKGALSPRKP